jgi:hypothetical protein
MERGCFRDKLLGADTVFLRGDTTAHSSTARGFKKKS